MSEVSFRHIVGQTLLRIGTVLHTRNELSQNVITFDIGCFKMSLVTHFINCYLYIYKLYLISICYCVSGNSSCLPMKHLFYIIVFTVWVTSVTSVIHYNKSSKNRTKHSVSFFWNILIIYSKWLHIYPFLSLVKMLICHTIIYKSIL